MMCDSGLGTSGQKWIKTKMKTPIRFNSNGNEVIAWCSLNVRSCLLLNTHHRCMCCCCQCSLHHIYVSWINNDDVHEGPEVVFGDKDIDSSLGVAREKVEDLFLNMCSTFQSNSCNNIPKCIMCCCMFTPVGAPKQMGT
jgi:hypothetical protein